MKSMFIEVASAAGVFVIFFIMIVIMIVVLIKLLNRMDGTEKPKKKVDVNISFKNNIFSFSYESAAKAIQYKMNLEELSPLEKQSVIVTSLIGAIDDKTLSEIAPSFKEDSFEYIIHNKKDKRLPVEKVGKIK